jgi:hypothetical protein
MPAKNRSHRKCALRPVLDSLEGRALLNAAMPHHVARVHDSAHVYNASHHNSRSSGATIVGTVESGGYKFTNFDGPNPGNMAGTGTNSNGISNNGTAAGFTISNSSTFTNFVVNPMKGRSLKVLNINGSSKANVFAVNSSGTVVGSDGNGNAFFIMHGKLHTFIPNGGMSAVALGINDHGTIVGQYVTLTATPGFIRLQGNRYITVNAPSGPNTVNAQGINNKDLVVGFYVGTDGQDHGFVASAKGVKSGALIGTAVADPVIPSVSGEPGATFVFSQILGVNDHGIAVGYYGDSTTSQHGFLYNTHTGKYTFLDDPSEAFSNGVEVTQITGITNSGEVTGFYTDANGVAHGFVATPGRM